jgi:hypothetical protein
MVGEKLENSGTDVIPQNRQKFAAIGNSNTLPIGCGNG